ncbi:MULTISPECIES: hypothetical protein [unclassified Rickettsia]
MTKTRLPRRDYVPPRNDVEFLIRAMTDFIDLYRLNLTPIP